MFSAVTMKKETNQGAELCPNSGFCPCFSPLPTSVSLIGRESFPQTRARAREKPKHLVEALEPRMCAAPVGTVDLENELRVVVRRAKRFTKSTTESSRGTSASGMVSFAVSQVRALRPQ